MSNNILQEILAHKRREVELQRGDQPLERVQEIASRRGKPRGFVRALKNQSANSDTPAIIAEIKRASPSKGIICADLDPASAGLSYARNGACCISVLTDYKFFRMSLAALATVRERLSKQGFETPLLRKDFIIDAYQVWQSLAVGADAILLIVAALEVAKLDSLLQEARLAGLDVLLEIHDIEELECALAAIDRFLPSATPASPNHETQIALGINNRDLKTFTLSLETTKTLAQMAKEKFTSTHKHLPLPLIVSESGIYTKDDIAALHTRGADAFLIGESLVANGDPGENLAKLLT